MGILVLEQYKGNAEGLQWTWNSNAMLSKQPQLPFYLSSLFLLEFNSKVLV